MRVPDLSLGQEPFFVAKIGFSSPRFGPELLSTLPIKLLASTEILVVFVGFVIYAGGSHLMYVLLCLIAMPRGADKTPKGLSPGSWQVWCGSDMHR
jgi:hypothetical protein